MARYCYKCGSSVNEDSVFCNRCGARLKLGDSSVLSHSSRLINPSLPIVTDYDDSFDKSSFEEVIRAANQGNPTAMYELGSRYRLGVDGAERDPYKAIRWYMEVLRYQNNRSAFYNTGYILACGECGEERARECMPYFEAAFELGSSSAASQLAIQYEYGELVTQDYCRAIAYYDMAIEFGNGNGSERTNKAQVYEKIGRMDLARRCWEEALDYYDGEIRNGRPEDASWCWCEKGNIHRRLGDDVAAKECYERAISCGRSAEAATMLGIYYEDGIPGALEADLSRAYQYYQLGYNTRDVDDILSAHTLARFLFFDKAGEGQDFKAFELFGEVRELGSRQANLYLGYYYGTGIPGHVDVDVELAFKLLDDVPPEDEPRALYYKAIICLKSLHDEQAAREFLEASARLGSTDAESLLKRLERDSVDPNDFVSKSQASLESGDLQGAYETIVRGYQMFPNNLAIMRQLVLIDDIVLMGKSLSRSLDASSKTFCDMVLDMIRQLRANSYGLEGLSSIESDMYFYLGRIHHNEGDIDTALSMLSKSNVDDTPDAALELFDIHTERIDRFIDEIRRDAALLKQSLNSKNWHNKTTQALAYLALSIIYSNGAPGVTTDVDYAYSCITQCEALDSNVAQEQIKKYRRNLFGRIVYTP